MLKLWRVKMRSEAEFRIKADEVYKDGKWLYKKIGDKVSKLYLINDVQWFNTDDYFRKNKSQRRAINERYL